MDRKFFGKVVLTAVGMAGAFSPGISPEVQAEGQSQIIVNGGVWQEGPNNAAVWVDKDGQTSPVWEMRQEILSAAPSFVVEALLIYQNGTWKYYLPRFADASTFKEVSPVASVYAVLRKRGTIGLTGMVEPIVGEPDLDVASIVYEKFNQERLKAGVAPLNKDPKLQAAAEKYASLLYNVGFPEEARGHELDGTPMDRAKQEGYLGSVSEVIGAKYRYSSGVVDAAQQVVDVLMASPPHRGAILNPMSKDIGVGCVRGTLSGPVNFDSRIVICVGDLGTLGTK